MQHISGIYVCCVLPSYDGAVDWKPDEIYIKLMSCALCGHAAYKINTKRNINILFTILVWFYMNISYAFSIYVNNLHTYLYALMFFRMYK